jgi:DNA-binding response OmpR family regulator
MSDILTIGPIRFDTESRDVESHGKTARLTVIESRLLRFLMEHANSVCTPQEMSLYAWGMSDDMNTRPLLKAAIRHLRQKIEPNPTHPVFLLTASGKGYFFQEPIVQVP